MSLSSILRQADERWQYWLVCSDRMQEFTRPHRRAVECDPRVRMVYQAQMAERLRSLPPRQVDAGITYSEADDALRGQHAIPIGIATGRVGNKHPVLNPGGDVRLTHRDDVVYYISRRRLY